MKKMLTPREVSRLTGISYTTTMKHFREGIIKGFRVGWNWFVTQENFKKYERYLFESARCNETK